MFRPMQLAELPPAAVMARLRALRALAERVETVPARHAQADAPDDLEGDAPPDVLDSFGDWREDWELRAAAWALGPGAREVEIAALADGSKA